MFIYAFLSFVLEKVYTTENCNDTSNYIKVKKDENRGK